MEPSQVHPTIAKHMLADGLDFVLSLSRSHGSYVYDELSQRKYLDFFGLVGSMPIAYNHPKITDPAFRERICSAALIKPTNSDFYTIQMAEFVDTFSRIAMPDHTSYLFFISGGALAVENALKVAFDWKVRKNIAHGKGKKGTKILAFQDAFHGRSGYTLSITHTRDPKKTMCFPRFDWPCIVNPKLSFPITPSSLESVIETEREAVRQIEVAVTENPDEIAALIIEPVQSEGGDNHFRPAFFAELRRLADEYEFLLIVDEVQTGIGMSGKWWAIEHMGIVADIIAFDKKAQVSGIIVGSRIDEVQPNCFHLSGRINSTFGGNLVDMVRCQRYLEIIEEDHLVQNAHEVGRLFLSGLQDLSEASSMMSNPRGCGLLLAFDLPTSRLRDLMLAQMRQNGMLALRSGERSVRLRPLLDLSVEDAKRGLEIIAESIPAT